MVAAAWMSSVSSGSWTAASARRYRCTINLYQAPWISLNYQELDRLLAYFGMHYSFESAEVGEDRVRKAHGGYVHLNNAESWRITRCGQCIPKLSVVSYIQHDSRGIHCWRRGRTSCSLYSVRGNSDLDNGWFSCEYYMRGESQQHEVVSWARRVSVRRRSSVSLRWFDAYAGTGAPYFNLRRLLARCSGLASPWCLKG